MTDQFEFFRARAVPTGSRARQVTKSEASPRVVLEEILRIRHPLDLTLIAAQKERTPETRRRAIRAAWFTQELLNEGFRLASRPRVERYNDRPHGTSHEGFQTLVIPSATDGMPVCCGRFRSVKALVRRAVVGGRC